VEASEVSEGEVWCDRAVGQLCDMLCALELDVEEDEKDAVEVTDMLEWKRGSCSRASGS
jgi:hypothetical protein